MSSPSNSIEVVVTSEHPTVRGMFEILDGEVVRSFRERANERSQTLEWLIREKLLNGAVRPA